MTDIRDRTHDQTSDGTSRSSWGRVTVAGLATLCLILTAIQVVNTTFIPPVAAFTAVLGGLAIALRRQGGTKKLLAASAASVILLVANAPAAIEDLRHPETFAGFALTTTAVVTGLVVAVSGVLGASRCAPHAARPVVNAAIGVAAVSVAVAGIATISTTDDQQETGDITIDVRNVEYPDITIPAGDNSLYIDNHDLIRHTLLIANTDVDIEIPGATARRLAVDLAPGTYEYICDVIGHEKMRGTITVTG